MKQAMVVLLWCRFYWRWLFTRFVISAKHHWTTYKPNMWSPWTYSLRFRLSLPRAVRIRWDLHMQIRTYYTVI